MFMNDNTTNKRINSGNFPTEELFPIPTDNKPDSKILEIYKYDIGDLLPYSSYIISLVFKDIYLSIKYFEEYLHLSAEEFANEINILINTGMDINEFAIQSDNYRAAAYTIPVATYLDKILWFATFNAYINSIFENNSIKRELFSQLKYYFAKALITCEKKELKSGYTLDIDNMIKDLKVIDILMTDWDVEESVYRIPIPYNERTILYEMFEKRKNLNEEIESSRAKSREYACNTNKEWERYIALINEIAKKERDTISQITDLESELTPSEKIKIIEKYCETVEYILDKKYIENGSEKNLSDLINTIVDRYDNAEDYCKVYSLDSRPFILTSNSGLLLVFPETYNYFLLRYHLLRLKPNFETAKSFFRLALNSLKRNFGETLIFGEDGEPKDIDIYRKDDTSLTIEDMICLFHDKIVSFIDINSKTINDLDFNKIQNDSVAFAEISSWFSGLYQLYDKLKGLTEEISAELINKIELNENDEFDENKVINSLVNASFNFYNDEFSNIDAQGIASQIVVSLNLIYLVADGISIIIDNKEMIPEISNIEKLENIKRSLQIIDDKLVHKVYANLPDEEIGMLEYREKTGVNPARLNAREKKEEEYWDSLFSDILKNKILKLLEGLKNKSIEQLLQTRTQIRQEIFRFPSCDQKNKYSEWLDQVSNSICDLLITKCKEGKNDYEQIKNGLIQFLGSKYIILDESVIDSLTTAELLYSKYASLEFANKGFDYSSISALYYQAFESAYNQLIWNPYAEKLNNYTISGESFAEIICDRKYEYIERSDTGLYGFLPSDIKDRNRFIERKNKKKKIEKTRVINNCMFSNFSFIMNRVKPESELTEFSEYCAKIFGYEKKETMFSDIVFMNNLSVFANCIESAATSRNNASHGGSNISIERCREDREIVLNNLEEIRVNYLGLFQQLLNLFEKVQQKKGT